MPNDAERNPAKGPEDGDDVIAEAALTFEEIKKESVGILWER